MTERPDAADAADAGHAPATRGTAPTVSVIMPTYRQGWGVRRALESLLWQDFEDWELIVVDDASPDATPEILAAYTDDPRIVHHRLDRNRGLGHALRLGTAMAAGRYLCYLPSDDVYFPGHLSALAGLLDARPGVYLAYSGVQSNHRWQTWFGATLLGDGAVGREARALEAPHEFADPEGPRGHNLLTLVQVMHRRALDGEVVWPIREEVVSDTIEGDHWRALLGRGARFAWTGAFTCEWVDHPEQRHKIIGESHVERHVNPWTQLRSGRGLAAYRSYYGVPADQPLNWRPSRGIAKDERHAEAFAAPVVPAGEGRRRGLRILIVGTLGFNADRVRALHAYGHELYGLWLPTPDVWDVTDTHPVTTVPLPDSREELARVVRRLEPDAVYALLNYHAVSLIHQVTSLGLEVPVFFHFKESAFHCLKNGLWPKLVDVYRRSAGHIFISEENRDWYRHHLPDALQDKPSMILDGDLPLARWMTDAWAEPRSRADGEIHTVCVGRPEGLSDFGRLAEQGIHVHLYGDFYRAWYDWVAEHKDSGYLHLHPTVHAQDWVSELSQYDAAWTHNLRPRNGGDLRAAAWPDLNLPSRLGTYASAGLPWLLPRAGGSRTALHSLAHRYGVGVEFDDVPGLAAALRDRARLTELRDRMRGARRDFAFDTHVERLTRFLGGRGR